MSEGTCARIRISILRGVRRNDARGGISALMTAYDSTFLRLLLLLLEPAGRGGARSLLIRMPILILTLIRMLILLSSLIRMIIHVSSLILILEPAGGGGGSQ